MRITLPLSAAIGLLASSALCQVTLPPHSAIYNGFTRGYNFTAATSFGITKLELPMDAYLAGDTASFMVRVNGNIVVRSVGTAGPSISPCLLINNGDVVDILGNWSPVVTGNFTAHNSYSASATNFPAMIEGVPHTLQRTGWQWDIGDAAFMSGPYLTPVAGQIGRIFIYTAPVAQYANCSSYGTGCGGIALGSDRPVIGGKMTLTTSSIPTTAIGGAAFLGAVQFSQGLSLSFLGMTNCFQYSGFDLTYGFPISGTTATASVTIPNNPAFNGAHVFSQSAVLAPGVNPFGAATSNGIDLRVGAQ